MIKSMLSSLPIYFMFLFVISRRVSLRLEQIQRDFLWVNDVLEKIHHLASWSITCLEKKDEGLNIRNLSTLNKT